MPKRLILNADDYGRTPGVSRGVRRAHRRGIVTSTSVMMNMPGVEADLRAALDACPTLGLGVHLTLTAGAPLLPPEQAPSLATADGQFPPLGAFVARLAALDRGEVRAEWQAQIEKFCRFAGRPPDHLDSHHHTSYFTPALFETMLDLAAAYGCALRRPLAADPKAVRAVVAGLPGALASQILEFAPRLLAERQIPHPDHLIVSFYGEGATLEHLSSILQMLPEGAAEIMCHPGFADGALLAGSGYARQRERELAVLTDSRIGAMIVEQGIQLITFAMLDGR